MAWIDQSAFADVNRPPVPGMLIHRSAALGSMSIPWADLHGQKRGEVKSYLPPVSKGPHTLLPDPTFISGLAVPAHRYVAVESDIMDVEVARRLQELSPAAAGALRLRRLEPGRYEIDGRLVTVRRRCATAWDGDDVCLLVHEDTVQGAPGVPLPAYLHQVANVALSLKRPKPPSAMTFADDRKPCASLENVNGEERFNAMQVACQQAKVREWAVSEISQRNPL